MKNLLGTYPLIIDIPVCWGDMDAFQHVNNTVYFTYFESARIAYFEQLQLLETIEHIGIGPILAETKCRFKIPLTYPDTISVGARVESVAEDRFFMAYAVASHRHRKIAAFGTGEVVTFDYRNHRKAPVPDELRNRIQTLEKIVPEKPVTKD